jgi:hypothetical protein
MRFGLIRSLLRLRLCDTPKTKRVREVAYGQRNQRGLLRGARQNKASHYITASRLFSSTSLSESFLIAELQVGSFRPPAHLG